MIDTKELIDSIKNGNQNIWTKVYIEYKSEFISWIRKNFSLDEEESAEIFQLTMVLFYENVAKGRVEHLTSSLKTYLFGIGKNKAHEALRYKEKKGKLKGYIQIATLDDSVDTLERAKEVDKQEVKMKVSIEKLGKPCSEILILFYFNKLSIADIATKMGYKSMATAKSQKFRCMERLRQIYFEAA